MFYATSCRVFFHDTMAYGTQHFLANLKFQCEAREHLLFSQILAPATQEERSLFDDVLFLTQEAFSRNLNSAQVGEGVGTLLSVEDPTAFSVRFCFRVVGQNGQPIACGFHTLATVSAKTRQLIAAPTLLRQYGHILRERVSAPNFKTRVLGGDIASLFPEYVTRTGRELARRSDTSPRLVPSGKAEADHTELWRIGLTGKAFLFPGTGSLSWSALAPIFATSGFRDLVKRMDQTVQSNLGYGVLWLATCRSEDDFARALRDCAGLDQICNYLTSAYCARVLDELGERPRVIIGHSAGELSALAVGGAYDVNEGVEVTCRRVASLAPFRGSGGMLAVGAAASKVESLIASAGASELYVSVINHQDQVAVSGPSEQLHRLRDLVAHLRIGHVLLASEYPFHCKLLEPAAETFAYSLGDFAARRPAIPVYSPLERDFYGPGRLAETVPFHFVRQLDYQNAIMRMYELGVREFVDCSPGATLKGIVKRLLAGTNDVTIRTLPSEKIVSRTTNRLTPIPARSVQPSDTPARSQDAHSSDPAPIVIVGLGCVLPGANNADQLWENIRNGVSSIVDLAELAPLEAGDFLYPGAIVPDKTYSLLSGLIDGTGYAGENEDGNTPSLAERMLKLAITQAVSALTFGDSKVRLIIGSTADGFSDLDEALLAARLEQTARDIANGQSWNDELSQALQRAFRRRPDHALTASANALLNRVVQAIFGPKGSAIAIDAACASSLYAIELGMEELRSNEIDIAVCGGVFAPGPANGCLFSQFGGLSATGSRPFDRSADGVVFSPGAALVALKRLPDALRDNDHVHGVIRGCGASSDGKGASVTEPKKDGQVLALQRAYAAARLEPRTVQCVEAHATATRVGDAVEVAALQEVFGRQAGPIALGSLKALIGHTGWAAGAASVIKVCRMLQHATIPLQPNFSSPSPDIRLAGSPLVIPSATLPWPRDMIPRRASVSGFGFGGTNSHLIIEEYDADHDSCWKDAIYFESATQANDIVVVAAGALRPDAEATSIDDRHLTLPPTIRVMPDVLDSMDRSQIMAVKVADQALCAIADQWPQWRREIGVVIGFEGKTRSSVAAVERIYLDRVKRRMSEAISSNSSAEAQQLVNRIIDAVRERTRPSGPYTLPGLMPNLVAGRISNLFDLRGPNFVIDAAGASLMQAVRIACSKVRRGDCKVMLAGAISTGVGHVSRLMSAECWRRDRPTGEAAMVLAIARGDFAREAGLRPLAVLSTAPAEREREETYIVGRAPNYLMAAEGAIELQTALSKAADGQTSDVRWRMPNGEQPGLRLTPPPGRLPAVEMPSNARETRSVEYCSVEYHRAPLRPSSAGTDIRDARVLVLCDQPHAMRIGRFAAWKYFSPSSTAEFGAHAVDPSRLDQVLSSIGDAAEAIDAIIAIKDLAGAPPEITVGNENEYSAFDLLVAFAQHLYPQIKQGRIQAAALCCNAWGAGELHPATGLFGGMLKSLARELPQARCKALYTDEGIGEVALAQLQAELHCEAQHCEIAYRHGDRYLSKLVLAARNPGTHLGLDSKSVVLATGGGRGVTAKLLEAILQRHHCSAVIFGRLDPGDLPASLRDADEATLDAYEKTFYRTGLRDNPGLSIKTLKQRFERLRACWEVHRTLDLLRVLGAAVEYIPLDITDAARVERALAAVRQMFGRLDLVIHGAGIQDSRTLNAKTLSDFRRVVRTKIDGVTNLYRACGRQFGGAQVRYHLVTSTFSVLGNDGQADYGAANEALNRMARWQSAYGLPWSALAWLGWAHVGMTRGSEYKQLAQARGMRPLSPEEGQELFVDFLADDGLKPVAVLMSRGESDFFKTPVIDRASRREVQSSGGWLDDGRCKVSLHTYPCLADHRVNGRPTLPGSFLIDLAVRSVQTRRNDLKAVSLSDVGFHRFIAIKDDKGADVRIRSKLISENRERAEYRVELRSDFVHSSGITLNPNILHYACTVMVAARSDIQAERSRLVEVGHLTPVADPYFEPRSPVSLGGVFRGMHDIRFGKEIRCASFLYDRGEVPCELSESSLPCVLLDALCRLSMLTIDADGHLPICVPLRCSRILIAHGVNDRAVLGKPIALRASAPRDKDDLMLNSYADATMLDGRVLLVLQGLAGKRIGAVMSDRVAEIANL
jgi:acyl transferase domain-containing protein/NAD(P)-dependent dehydrogenase (short-subunit alcohol dehydrogenase family)